MLTTVSPAKINLHLRVYGKREDGYHDIATLMQQISLYDEISFTHRERGITLSCPDSSLPEDDGNIVYQAAQAFFSRISSLGGVSIILKKRIPIAAGLGGGSSNAAITLLALNEMKGNPCSRDDLMELGKELGADVPFFLFGRTAWAFKRGDCLREAPPLPPLWYVLVNPGFPLSTKMIYEKLNLQLTNKRRRDSISHFDVIPAINPLEGLHNDLEKVTLKLHPSLRLLKQRLMSCGATGALMSGSGPTVFGVFMKERLAIAALQTLKTQEGTRRLWTAIAHSL